MSTIPQQCLLQWAQRQPERAAIIAAGRRTSYAELTEGAQWAAGWWYAQGVRPGDHVALGLVQDDDQTVHQIELMYGLAWLGAVLLIVPQGAAAASLGRFLQKMAVGWLLDSAPEQRVVAGFAEARTLRFSAYQAWRVAPSRLAATLPRAAFSDLAGQGVPPEPPVGPVLDIPHVPHVPVQTDASRPLAFELTSGTTGTPKAVLHTHGRYLAALQSVQSVLPFEPTDVLLGPMRWPSKVGWRSVLRSHCWGATHVEASMPQQWDDWVRLQRETGLTGANPTPGQLRTLLASVPAGAPPATPLRVMSSAGAALLPSDVAQARAHLCPRFQVLYASTETGIVAHLPADAPPDAALQMVPGVHVKVIGPAGQVLPTGQVGRLRISSAWAAPGYWHNTGLDVSEFADGGYLSDDIGRLTATGGLILSGRHGDTINFGGIKIPPRLVESTLLQFPALVDVAVLACPHVTAGEIPVAFLVFKGRPDMQDLHQFLSQHLDSYHFPVAFVPCAYLPRTAEGKLDAAALRALFISRLSSTS